MDRKRKEKETPEIVPLGLDDIDVEALEERLEMAPVNDWCCCVRMDCTSLRSNP